MYNRVVEACALLPDFQVLPGGDQTEIGEKVYFQYVIFYLRNKIVNFTERVLFDRELI